MRRIDRGQDVSLFDELVQVRVHGAHLTGHRRCQAVLHFHGFQNNYRIPLGHLISRFTRIWMTRPVIVA